MGEIAACNVTNDIFAMNAPEISGMLVFLAIKTNTPSYIAEGILNGIKRFMETKIDSKVVGGHTIYCDWPLIGGEASGFVKKEHIIPKGGVKAGDQLILTKPIGLQAIMAAYRILKEFPEMLKEYSKDELQKSIDYATELMITSNQPVVKTIHLYEDFSFVHSMTDVTGFGLAGHTREMLQDSNLSATIETVPIIKLSKILSEDLGYAMDDCRCHETAGGMLMAIDKEYLEEFVQKLRNNGIPNWLVGEIEKKKASTVTISDEVEYFEVLG
ncbi:MAG: selenide, water dikinase SelD [Candidatus Lokiarchaeota archaeon]|nr:selenide, water dikinase SelD [Candidatus Lokiarchaeota archaeon]MBD3339482.1 selenide, water dikinase SelD [Candidatus Lokiarchaeota archaeon]